MVISCMPEHRLSEAERAVVDYINKQQCIISLLSMEDIASGAFVSNATVSRAIRKCGFSSFSEMKYRLAEDAKNDRTSEQMNRVLSMSYTECIETVKRIDIPTVLAIVEQIRRADTVYLLANGLTALIANEFAIQLQCQKIRVCLISDSEMMRKMDLFCTERDLVLVLSVKNSTPELSIGVRLAKKNGAAVACCLCTKGTVLDELCDLALYGYSQPIYPNRFFGGTSRIGLMIMTRTIVEYMESETAAYAEENEK
ncbi:MAG: MurR/RpiR family transcriptional regulator [Ruminococcaceae bacterium]|nr:MurR/RpiR family transcriptional regulator [Oscillospiraceae bacterium]